MVSYNNNSYNTKGRHTKHILPAVEEGGRGGGDGDLDLYFTIWNLRATYSSPHFSPPTDTL